MEGYTFFGKTPTVVTDVTSLDINTLKEEIAALKKENAMLKTKIGIVADVVGVRFIQIGKANEFYATARTKVDDIQEI